MTYCVQLYCKENNVSHLKTKHRVQMIEMRQKSVYNSLPKELEEHTSKAYHTQQRAKQTWKMFWISYRKAVCRSKHHSRGSQKIDLDSCKPMRRLPLAFWDNSGGSKRSGQVISEHMTVTIILACHQDYDNSLHPRQKQGRRVLVSHYLTTCSMSLQRRDISRIGQ